MPCTTKIVVNLLAQKLRVERWLTVHIELDFVVLKVSDVDPLVVAGRDLLVVDDVVPGRAVAVHVEPKVVATKT